MKPLIFSPSPHLHTSRTTGGAMRHVIIALLPAIVCSLYYFGLPALSVLVVSVISCVAIEWFITRFMLHRPSTIGDGSAVLTGILLAMNLPSNLPLWMVASGALIAIGIAKMAFGGLGCNIFNPALVGRVFMLISFPVAMTIWPLPGNLFVADAHTGATILSALKEGTLPDMSYGYMDLFIGNRGGSMGEVSSIALIIGFVYLLAVRVISWHITVAIIATVVVFDLCLGIPPGLDVLSGGLLLGSIFMATDYVTSPMTHRGQLVYGFFIGVLTVVIRRWGAYPEGVSFAILIMNGFTPLINLYVKPRRYGINVRKEVAA